MIGDTNIDYLRWQDPEASHQRLTDRTKDEVDTIGFTQVIEGHTRSWKGQQDSLVDKCWLNRPNRLISWVNEDRSKSDHNYIAVILRTKDKTFKNNEVHKRLWKNICPIKFKNEISNIDWGGFYDCNNIYLLNDTFENEVGGIFGENGPHDIYTDEEKSCELVG